jgi:hypothetical protein
LTKALLGRRYHNPRFSYVHSAVTVINIGSERPTTVVKHKQRRSCGSFPFALQDFVRVQQHAWHQTGAAHGWLVGTTEGGGHYVAQRISQV